MRGSRHRIATASPVDGLARRTVGFVDVLGQSVAALAPSAAAVTIPMLTFAVAGGGSAIAVLIAAVVSLGVVASINVFAKRVAAAGAIYTYVSLGLGRRASLVASAAMLLGYGLIAVFELFAATHFVAQAVGGHPAASAVIGIALGGGLLVVLLGGIRLSTRLILLVEVVTIATLIVIVVLLLTQLPADRLELTPRPVSLDRIVLGIVVSMSAFVGFESAAALGVEAKRPFATIPRALVCTVAVAGALFLFVAVAGLVAVQALGFDSVAGDAPFDAIAQLYGARWMAVALDAMIAFSFFAAAVAAATALVRLLFSLSREGALPDALGRTSHRTGVPTVATAACVPLVVAPVVLRLGGMDVHEAMDTVLVAAVGCFVLGYILVCAAVVPFLRRLGELTLWPAVRAVATGIVLVAGMAGFLGIAIAAEQAAGVLLLAVLLVAAIIALAVLGRRAGTRGVARDVPLASEVLGGERALIGGGAARGSSSP